MKKILVLLVILVPLLRATVFAQEPSADLQIISFSFVDQKSNDLSSTAYGYVFSEGIAYYLKVKIRNCSKKKYNGAVRLEVMDIYNQEITRMTLFEKQINLDKSKEIDLIFEITHENLKHLKNPVPYDLFLICQDSKNSLYPWLYLRASVKKTEQIVPSWKILIGDESFKKYDEKRKTIEKKLRDTEEKRIEKQKNNSNNTIQRQWDSEKDIFRNPYSSFCHFHQCDFLLFSV